MNAPVPHGFKNQLTSRPRKTYSFWCMKHDEQGVALHTLRAKYADLIEIEFYWHRAGWYITPIEIVDVCHRVDGAVYVGF